MKFLINIGLDVKASTTLSADVAKQIVRAYNFLIERETLLQSDTEPTLVLEVIALIGPTLALQGFHGIATDLKQDCIAVYRPKDGKGALIGPNAKAWGEFNPAYFFLLDGTRLGGELKEAA